MPDVCRLVSWEQTASELSQVRSCSALTCIASKSQLNWYSIEVVSYKRLSTQSSCLAWSSIPNCHLTNTSEHRAYSHRLSDIFHLCWTFEAARMVATITVSAPIDCCSGLSYCTATSVLCCHHVDRSERIGQSFVTRTAGVGRHCAASVAIHSKVCRI
jgi:hypothetical protein